MHIHLVGGWIRRIERVADGGLGIGPDLVADRAELRVAGDLLLDEPAAEDGDRIALLPPILLLLLAAVVAPVDVADVHAAAEELGRVYHPTLAIHASPDAFAQAVAELRPPEGLMRSDWRRGARQDYLAWSTPPATNTRLDLGRVVRILEEKLGPEAVFCNGAGNYTI